MKTDKLRLGDMYVDGYMDEVPLNYRRSRYACKTYTWVEAYINGQWRSLGDPWPCVTPPPLQVRDAINIVRQRLS